MRTTLTIGDELLEAAKRRARLRAARPSVGSSNRRCAAAGAERRTVRSDSGAGVHGRHRTARRRRPHVEPRTARTARRDARRRLATLSVLLLDVNIVLAAHRDDHPSTRGCVAGSTWSSRTRRRSRSRPSCGPRSCGWPPTGASSRSQRLWARRSPLSKRSVPSPITCSSLRVHGICPFCGDSAWRRTRRETSFPMPSSPRSHSSTAVKWRPSIGTSRASRRSTTSCRTHREPQPRRSPPASRQGPLR